MDWADWALWGFVGTIVLTITMSAAQGLGLTRMSIPFLLGTVVTPDRDRAQLLGIAVHLINGWLFSLVYVAAFHAWGLATWWAGAAIGVVHSAFVLTAGLSLLPAFHPRMARIEEGPDQAPLLEPPGFLALNYGVRTPVSVVLAHILFGAVVGGFYSPG